MRYDPPNPKDLEKLKQELKFNSTQMADLFGVQGGRQWRKYTGGEQPRDISPHILFFAAARLELSAEDFERVLARMRAIGATIDLGSGESS
ncbi:MULTISPECIES: transcriptional regulator [Burkholderia cepacia complex]|uniref:Transcriptional regulator n=1 Tax=Burkholderia cenocepacia TaxID=95486 RepID=A0A1V2VVN1_9BURK|nr:MULTISPECIES: transcriptional regulator [Burkholderia cepacia complex]MCA8321247.1 XRE family transcriptional regulator [Burkholderia cepacia]ONU48651.1 transcriptional regulator [Burkholderia cenocepacia]ONU49965.1 transcriptional regulator [Burkholderia cenocepacia]ONU51592.1 transcriptional regulator [Burkholderia cenocepacia]ONU53318.1 transcriptional regulator [Burkholderia cenocepacia]